MYPKKKGLTDLEIYKSIKQSTIFGGKPLKPYRKRGQFLTF